MKKITNKQIEEIIKKVGQERLKCKNTWSGRHYPSKKPQYKGECRFCDMRLNK